MDRNHDHCKSGDLLRLVSIVNKESIFNKFSLKEDWRIIPLKFLKEGKADGN